MAADSSVSSGATKPKSWVVLGDREYGISYGPYTEAEAKRFASAGYGRIAVSLAGASSQSETCAAYGFDYKPLQR